MDRQVFLSLLALDAYNRGYGENVGGLEFVPNVTKLGHATIIEDAITNEELDAADVIAAGFYAIAYAWNGETVISFRGTNVASPAWA